ncbi:Endo-1,4-beta-xylanase A precursor [compost metagenome]
MKFTDVPADSWSAEAIAAMSSRGLVDGFEGGTFRPRASLTRGEMAALLSRAQPLLTK